VEIRILGPLEVLGENGQVLPLSGHRQRALVAALALRPRMVVPTDRLVEELWGEHPPKTAPVSLQNAVSSVRKALGPDVIVTRPPGYLLDVPREAVDSHRFERLLTDARAAPPAARRGLVTAALALWRGPPLGEFGFMEFAQSEIRRLEELNLTAVELRIGADIELGGAAGTVPELEAIVEREPLREEPRRLLMLALYRSGRQAEALELYQRTRRAFVEELGVEPGVPLRELQAAILRHDVVRAEGTAGDGDDVEGEIVRALRSGALVPVLGLDGAHDLAADLARAFAVSPDGLELARISQRISTLNGPGPLRDELHARFRHGRIGPLERFLAAMPTLLRGRGLPHQLIVSARYDRALEAAFAEAGEELDIVSYAAEGPERGRFWHQPPDAEPHRIDVPNTYASELSLERRTVLLRLQGVADPDDARSWESFVITEDDYIDYPGTGDLAAVLPVSLAATLRRSHLLFLGYELTDWGLRLLRSRLFPLAPLAYRSWAVSSAPPTLARALWRRQDIEVVDADPEAFCELLRARLEVE
jgi:DNA-binding SARP family transcriptional activator